MKARPRSRDRWHQGFDSLHTDAEMDKHIVAEIVILIDTVTTNERQLVSERRANQPWICPKPRTGLLEFSNSGWLFSFVTDFVPHKCKVFNWI